MLRVTAALLLLMLVMEFGHVQHVSMATLYFTFCLFYDQLLTKVTSIKRERYVEI